MTDATRLKQTYLREQIIDGGYDAGTFAEYLANQRPSGEDVDVWSMESLEDMVERFKKDYRSDDVSLQLTATPEKQMSTSMAQKSAQMQSRASSDDDNESGDEDPSLRSPEKKVIDIEDRESSAKQEDVMEEDLIRRTRLDQSDVLQASKATGNLGTLTETERIKKDLFDKALAEKKMALVIKFN